MNTSICGQISQLTCNVIRRDVCVPVGHIVIAERWAGSELHTALKSLLQTVVSDHLGLVDFYPSSDSAVLYITEADLLSEHAIKRKIVKLRKRHELHLGLRGCGLEPRQQNNAKKPYVIAEQAEALQEQYNNLQQFAVMELGIPVMAVHNQLEAAQLLAQMEAVESGEKQNPFLAPWRLPPLTSALATCLLRVPGLGEVKAKALLQKYHSLRAIASCSTEDLTKAVGPASATSIHKFFNGLK
ncbi:Fanconi anemia core complex-associated protein 24-like isoform X2 [Dermacentor andersoni]|uniref:Fanconi anemia core complex-associated protein 24-like isoform X2 n=1 Tax=Dermacentor andersoni TaxID=34620 RepID=UPI0024167C94|nr:Fanconi anemia core complex-associated protein 24-like isoform X2 [Dermacentor andersoni]